MVKYGRLHGFSVYQTLIVNDCGMITMREYPFLTLVNYLETEQHKEWEQYYQYVKFNNNHNAFFAVKKCFLGRMFKKYVDVMEWICNFSFLVFQKLPYALGITCVPHDSYFSWKYNIFKYPFSKSTREVYKETAKCFNNEKTLKRHAKEYGMSGYQYYKKSFRNSCFRAIKAFIFSSDYIKRLC